MGTTSTSPSIRRAQTTWVVRSVRPMTVTFALGLRPCSTLSGPLASGDIKLLAKLTKLEKLIITGNKITDLKPLVGLTELQALDLRRNKITDLSPLAELKQLKEVSLYANYITMEEVTKLEKALPKCKIFHNADD